jgi:cytochrome bd ubiquinol oxidase subunit I
MVALGILMILLSIIGVFFWWRKKLLDTKWLLVVLVPSFILPHLANLLGWASAEIGRQPWAVYGILKTSDAISKTVSASQLWFSLIMFSIIYIALLVLFIILLRKKIKKGPDLIEVPQESI